MEESMQASNAKATCKRGAAYTIKEDELLCIAWLEVSQDPIRGAEQRGSAYWKRIHEYFHEWKNYPPHCFTSDHNESSLAHRWSTIQDATNKFCGAFEQVNNRKVSGIGIKDHMGMAMSLYNSNEGKPFGFVHCWTKLNKAPKWEAIVSSLKEGHGSSKKQKSNEGSSCQSSSLNEDGEAGEGLASGGRVQRPKGRKWEKAKEKRAKSTKDAWAEIMANKQLACGKRVEEKEAKKEERHQAFMEIQRQKVALEQKKVDTDAENAATARLSEDSKIMFADTSLMDENQ
ncbi:glutathione S-transferase T3 [Brachypodium distachyon]|uniref:No apical meristem-associated C-terminal domain-containing protein n=1 Tax=Brachypodium distachyon TaxID=15368 RepID=I1GLN5_BRADI|nr:glutathione S-transferase T3 [Brachypodium distachyon]XP_010227803.1 glutathione S-transferase T3 [Brachypodium distachyon]KQK12493.1 hypothetical protein BRADI_1g04055v3 [Brachypodium distachyon]|eukprot:XP_010227798.1 glutathione S-transferase T3 [Brachypodium distachyon]